MISVNKIPNNVNLFLKSSKQYTFGSVSDTFWETVVLSDKDHSESEKMKRFYQMVTMKNHFSKLRILEPPSYLNKRYKILLENKYIVDLDDQSFFDIIMSLGLQPGGEVIGEFTWAKANGLKLIRIGSKPYLDYLKSLEIKSNPSALFLRPGGVYRDKKDYKFLYIGNVVTSINDQHYNKFIFCSLNKSSPEHIVRCIENNKHVFYLLDKSIPNLLEETAYFPIGNLIPKIRENTRCNIRSHITNPSYWNRPGKFIPTSLELELANMFSLDEKISPFDLEAEYK